MSRRNGRSLARAVIAVTQEARDRLPGAGHVQMWQRILESRPGWRRVNPHLYEFRTGDRLTLGRNLSSKELIAQMTAIEVKPLAEGLPAQARDILSADAVEAATDWWQRRGGTKCDS